MNAELIYLGIFLFLVLSWLFFALIIYFIPIIVGYVRKHNNLLAICLMTIFIGWTFFGWLAALLWALNSDTKDDNED
ncbi:MAG: superinfection immunity protein [Candidatus Gastranaerophilales bacterium]|nr:superinfection immunity protein [Candidatus Gastranaerophilales bacterium]